MPVEDGRGNIYGYVSPRDPVEYRTKDVFGTTLTWQGPKTIAWLLGTDGMAVHDRFASNDPNQKRVVMELSETSSITSSDLRYRWQTKYEELVPLIFFGKRYFHPQLGRFIQRDPIGTAGGRNLYAFAGNDPVNFTDPRGESAVGSGGGPTYLDNFDFVVDRLPDWMGDSGLQGYDYYVEHNYLDLTANYPDDSLDGGGTEVPAAAQPGLTRKTPIA